jgi:glycosyltransferase involved in cell wall biosynthesis
MNILSIMRVRNESRWIAEVITSILPITSNVHIFDDRSDDSTVDICRQLGAVVHPSPFSTLDEARDKNWLLRNVADPLSPDFILCTDGDEILDPNTSHHLRSIPPDPHHRAYSLRILYLWNNRYTIRKDGVYGNFWRPSLFRWSPNLTFRSTSFGGNFHCGNIPSNLGGTISRLPVNLLHLGYMLPEDRLRKFEWYNRIDPGNAQEDEYRHMVQGDVPSILPTDRLVHAGPLTLESL